MSNIKMKVTLPSIILIAVLLALSVDYHGGIVPEVRADEQEAPPCSVRTLRGRYGNSFQFLNLPPGSIVPQPLSFGTHTAGAGISVYTFDGNGNLSGPGTASFGGQIQQLTTAGTYTVNANCAGSMLLNITIDGQFTIQGTLEFVIVNGGKEIFTLSSGQGEIAVGTMKKQF